MHQCGLLKPRLCLQGSRPTESKSVLCVCVIHYAWVAWLLLHLTGQCYGYAPWGMLLLLSACHVHTFVVNFKFWSIIQVHNDMQLQYWSHAVRRLHHTNRSTLILILEYHYQPVIHNTCYRTVFLTRYFPDARDPDHRQPGCLCLARKASVIHYRAFRS